MTDMTDTTEEREHWLYADENGNPEECIEDCPGCFPEDYPDVVEEG